MFRSSHDSIVKEKCFWSCKWQRLKRCGAKIKITGCEDYENTFARVESDCSLRIGFKVLMKSISYTKQSNLFLHFLSTWKRFSRSWGIVPWSHYSPILTKIIVLVYTQEVISTKSERKPLKSTIWLTDQITRKFKNRSLQNFQTWQFTSLSFRKQQRNGLNGTAKSLNCFLTWEEKWSFVVFCWLAKFIAKRACCVVLRMKCWQKWRLGCSR